MADATEPDVTQRDIEVSWVLSAACSICEDGLGEVEVVDTETLECKKCGSWWGPDGDYQGTEAPDEHPSQA